MGPTDEPAGRTSLEPDITTLMRNLVEDIMPEVGSKYVKGIAIRLARPL